MKKFWDILPNMHFHLISQRQKPCVVFFLCFVWIMMLSWLGGGDKETKWISHVHLAWNDFISYHALFPLTQTLFANGTKPLLAWLPWVGFWVLSFRDFWHIYIGSFFQLKDFVIQYMQIFLLSNHHPIVPPT